MISDPHIVDEARLVAAQIGRPAREPWRVRVRCRWGYPVVIASPSLLDDGTPFPTHLWLSCPWLTREVSALESAGGCAHWESRAASDEMLASALVSADAALKSARREESGGVDACCEVGVAGQADPLRVKCLHARVALALCDILDPVGAGVLASIEPECPDRSCAELLRPEGGVTP